ncbi:ATP synthase delta/epsilon chain alpha-helix domain-containing protein [Clostridium sp. AL.422]|uniref:ATP synthase delta/epsilon chain alpha-helix domain-containing protein n=1 Tax=Clostridium TaxID=1485 RepID=UPI00293DD275|nr:MULTISPECIES: ATP synthase delta/epsilon chain alpha-helix domain-containing protein [unclassified Clostridium]MDV4151598.1 ATP synthase delta/epsilon chain alpha-helix domain-containing protein [Clostridium sp. AL.422]
MSNTFKITIVSLGKKSIEFEGEALITSTFDGQIEFKSNHAPIIVSTVPATTTIINGNSKEELFTSAGIVYVKNNELKFCCDAAEKSSEIDRDRALKSKDRAEKRLKENNNVDIERAKRALARANARIRTLDINN